MHNFCRKILICQINCTSYQLWMTADICDAGLALLQQFSQRVQTCHHDLNKYR
jgi:hypothetical protein